jgi:hypothetical protein
MADISPTSVTVGASKHRMVDETKHDAAAVGGVATASPFGMLPDGDLQLTVVVKQTMFLIGDRSEAYFSLYSARDRVFITYE